MVIPWLGLLPLKAQLPLVSGLDDQPQLRAGLKHLCTDPSLYAVLACGHSWEDSDLDVTVSTRESRLDLPVKIW